MLLESLQPLRFLAGQVSGFFRRRGNGHIGVQADNVRLIELGKPGCDHGPPVAALGAVARIAKPAHQFGEGANGPLDVPAALSRRPGEAVAGQRRNDQVKRLTLRAGVPGRVGEPVHNLAELDHRTGPAMHHQQRQGIGAR